MHDSSFETLGLMPACLEALIHEGYTHPTPIQKATIPTLLAGRDLLGCAQTGTGKTAAFALPTIQHLVQTPGKRQPRKARALVIAPTRELAMQIDVSFAAYGRRTEIKRACVYGGVGKVPQIKAMERGVDVLTATPGRLLDLKSEGYIDLSAVEIVVFDEADRMLDMGFIHDVRKIIALLPKDRQTLLFSATIPREIEELARTMLRDPVRIDIEPEKPAVELIAQSLYHVEKGNKRELLVHLIKHLKVTRAVVFSRTKHGADRIAKSLHLAGIQTGVIHANKGQGNRTRTMETFRSGETPVLVATDLAARGIDVDDISHVFNFDLPTEPETYVHRIGRTARAGASGTAVSFCDTEEKRLLRQIEQLLGGPIPVQREHPYAGLKSPDSFVDEDKLYARQGRGRDGRQSSGRPAAGRPDSNRPPSNRPPANRPDTRQRDSRQTDQRRQDSGQGGRQGQGPGQGQRKGQGQVQRQGQGQRQGQQPEATGGNAGSTSPRADKTRQRGDAPRQSDPQRQQEPVRQGGRGMPRSSGQQSQDRGQRATDPNAQTTKDVRSAIDAITGKMPRGI
jgi:ATP-dependent RNA helicase RhlE